MSTNRSKPILRMFIVGLCAMPVGLRAQTIELGFEPPDMAVSAVCVPRVSDADLTLEWGAWDGKTLPDRDVGLINRDMRRLAELDAAAWDTTIQTVISMLPDVSPSYTEDHVTLARIDQMIALGNLQELKAQGLVRQLLDKGDANSARMKYALSKFLTDGIGIDRDAARGAALLMEAGYGGNADALLRLSHLAVAGDAPEGWDISPQLAVTMAFGALVGQIDPLICDRIARIAREYSSGEVVSLNHDLAARWYRFAADLGDPLAAWRVAEYQLQSELVTKDNDVLLTYLAKAAEGRLPYAQVMLGRVYEAGALVPADTELAHALYEAAAANDRAGLIRLSGFIEQQLPTQPDLQPAFLDTLVRLEELADVPPWVYAKHAAIILADEGRWSGADAARILLEKGAALHDPAAISMLAQMDFGNADTDAEFYTVVDRLIYAVTTLGEVSPTADLQAAFMCKAPNAPLLAEADYWAKAEAAIGSSSLQFTDRALAQLADDPDPMTMASLQTQALYGRATPLANLLVVLEQTEAPPSQVAFWTNYARQFPGARTARASLALAQASTPAARDAALDALREAVLSGDHGAAFKLAEALLDNGTDVAQAEALPLLLALAGAGNGEAMALLPIADPASFPTPRAVFDAYATAIAARGDFHALLLAMPFLPDPETRATYRARAISAMHCTFPEAVAFATVLGTAGDQDEARRWLTIATHLAGEDSWQLVQLADSYRSVLGAEGDETALALYDEAFALGSRTAVQRLLRLHGDPTLPGYDQARIVTLYTELVARSDAGQIPAVLTDLARKAPDLRLAIEARLDLGALYQQSAEAGNATAMREHAIRLRATAVSDEEIALATGWLVRASEGGDVPAMVMLAQAYSMGVGVPPSLDNARRWIERAAEAGDPTAIDMVKLFTDP